MLVSPTISSGRGIRPERKKPDGLQSECRAAQAERRGKIGQTVLRIGVFVAVAMAFHWIFASILGIFSGMSAAMPWNWFSDSGMDIGDDWEAMPVDPVPIDYPDDLSPGKIIEEPIEPEPVQTEPPEDYPYRMPDRAPNIAVGYGNDWRSS